MHVEPDALGFEGGAEACLAGVGIAADPGGHVDLVGVALVDEGADLGDGVAGTQHEAAAALAQSGVQIGQAVGEEGEPVGSGEAGRVDGPVADEERHHPVAGGEGRAQRRMVVQAQVGGVQDHRDVHGFSRSASGPGGRLSSGTSADRGRSDAAASSSRRRAARAMLRAMPPKTTAWKGDTLHQ